MSELLATGLAGIILNAVTGWLGFLFGVRQERASEERARRLLAAQVLTQPLRRLHGLLRRHGQEDVEEVESGEVSDAFSNWSTAWDTHAHRLPQNWRHPRTAFSTQTGTVFGGGARVHSRPDMARFPLGEPDVMWQQYADDYLEYAASGTLTWGDSDPDTPKKLKSYEEWLVTTWRRDPCGDI